jgi:hypothetical protein
MPTYVEVETLDGEVYRWVLDDSVIEKLQAVLGQPDSILV